MIYEPDPLPRGPRPLRPALIRIAAATAFALAFSWGVYVLLNATREHGTIGFAFLLVLPAVVSAFVAYVADPWKTRSVVSYLLVPCWLLAAVVVLSIFVLREGTICIVLLSPLWIGSGALGAAITYRLRRRVRNDRAYGIALFALPLTAMMVEPYIPIPATDATVTRSIVIAATPEQLWPLMRGVPDVRPGEGRWNLTQEVLGVPRPLGATMPRDGVGADRLARWDHNVAFRERITEWRPGRRLSWRFVFDNVEAWGYDDRHLLPDSPYFTVVSGGYAATPLAPGRTRLTLHTTYRLRTPVNAYARAWGELLLGDLEDNILAVLKGRAEARR